MKKPDKEKIVDRRRVTLENSIGFIPMFAGRPERELSISKDDVLNVKITLNTTESVVAFVKEV